MSNKFLHAIVQLAEMLMRSEPGLGPRTAYSNLRKAILRQVMVLAMVIKADCHV
jgi:hypothetical protein